MERSTVQSCLAAPSISRNEHESAFSRHPKPEFCSPVSPSCVERAQGRPGADGHPRSAARKCSARKPHSSIQVTPNTRPSLRNGLTAYAALSPATNSCCHRHFAKVDAPRPVGAMHRRRKLGCSDDSRDHTVLPYAAISGFAKGLRRTRRLQLKASLETQAPFVRHGLRRAHGGRLNPLPALLPHPRRRCRVHRIPNPRS